MSSKSYKELYNLGLRYECFEHYSGGPPHCIQCGNHDLRLLQLDHKNDDGKEQRENMMKEGYSHHMVAGHPFYGYLRKLGYPDDRGLQVLCVDCHYKKGKPRKNVVINNYYIFNSSKPIEPIIGSQLSLWEEV